MTLARTLQIAEVQWKAYCKLCPTLKEAFGEELPKGLQQVLIDTESLILATHGTLQSRQVVAGLIVTWVLSQPRPNKEK